MPTPDDSDCLVVLTTLPDAAQARALVRELVQARVVACGTVLPQATSIYRWQGRIDETSEAQVLLKTLRSRWSDLEREIRARHPYDVPELLALPVSRGLDAYMAWLATETAGGAAA